MDALADVDYMPIIVPGQEGVSGLLGTQMLMRLLRESLGGRLKAGNGNNAQRALRLA